MDAEMELVLDTLYNRRRSDGASCLTVNQAGLTLLKSEVSIVPVIEQVLKEVVDPAVAGNWPEGIKLPGLDPLWSEVIRHDPAVSKFPGLDYVLGAYLVLGVKSNPERIVDFLATVSPPLLVKTVLNIPVFFAREGEGYNSGVSPDGRLMAFVRSLLKDECEEIRIAAAQALKRMNGTVSQECCTFRERSGNVVVIEYELNGTRHIRAFDTVGQGGRHGEFIARDALPEGATLRRLFTERQPCQLAIPNCDRSWFHNPRAAGPAVPNPGKTWVR